MNAPRPFQTSRPLAFGIFQALGLGAFAGALEAVILAASLKLPLSAGGFLALGILDALVMALFAGLVAAAVGGAAFLRPSAQQPDADPVPGWSWQLGLTVFALTGFYFWGESLARIGRGDPIVGALALAAMPIGFAGIGYYNARFWFRWMERNGRPWGLPILAWGGSAVIVLVATIGFANRDVGGTAGFDDDRNAVLVTVDGLPADVVGRDDAPTLTALADRPGGLSFDNAVTPIPASRPANVTVLTGLHPLRHQVVTEDQQLSTRFPTLFTEVGDEGWQTAAFVSTHAAGTRSGLGADLHLLDDALTPGAWLGNIELVGRLRQLTGSGNAHRDASTTIGVFSRWLARRDDRPFVAWLHLADPLYAAIEGDSPDDAVASTDAAIATLLQALQDAGLRQETLVMVAGSHGAASDGSTNRGLREATVRVPIVLEDPKATFAIHRVGAQVRTLDVVNTISDALELAPIDTSEGVTLLAYGREDREASMSCTLVGQDADDHWLLGLRNNGVKYWIDREGRETLYYLRDDPDETTNLTERQPDVLNQVRSVLVSDRAAMQRLIWR